MVWTASDRARAAVLAERWGGVVSHTIGCGGDGVCVEWSDRRGYTVTLAGADAGEVLGMLSTVLRDTDAAQASKAGHIHSEGVPDGNI